MRKVSMPEAWLSEDRQTVLMKRGQWRGHFPVEKLDSQLQFYRELRDRRRGQFAHIYQPVVAALEAVQRDLAASDDPAQPLTQGGER